MTMLASPITFTLMVVGSSLVKVKPNACYWRYMQTDSNRAPQSLAKCCWDGNQRAKEAVPTPLAQSQMLTKAVGLLLDLCQRDSIADCVWNWKVQEKDWIWSCNWEYAWHFWVSWILLVSTYLVSGWCCLAWGQEETCQMAWGLTQGWTSHVLLLPAS